MSTYQQPNAELSAVKAAEILHVSRPFFIKLLEAEQIPYRRIGKHRRIRMEDVMNYKQAIDQEREAVLDRLVEDAQEQDMGYD
jgi:excisionase family DNA binding protein